MTDEARSTLARLTEIPNEFWIALVVVVVVGTIAAAVVRAPWDDTADTSPLDDRDEYARRCGVSLDDLICDRVSGHGGVHTDSRHGRELGWARWSGGDAA